MKLILDNELELAVHDKLRVLLNPKLKKSGVLRTIHCPGCKDRALTTEHIFDCEQGYNVLMNGGKRKDNQQAPYIAH